MVHERGVAAVSYLFDYPFLLALLSEVVGRLDAAAVAKVECLKRLYSLL